MRDETVYLIIFYKVGRFVSSNGDGIGAAIGGYCGACDNFLIISYGSVLSTTKSISISSSLASISTGATSNIYLTIPVGGMGPKCFFIIF